MSINEKSSFAHKTSRPGAFIARFVRTSAISFLITVFILWALGAVPAGFSDFPRRIVVSLKQTTLNEEAALASILPDRTGSEEVSGVTKGNDLSPRSVETSGGAGVDWLPREESSLPASPIALSIPAVFVSAPIVTPDSTHVAVLDAALQTGVVHYPDSGFPGERTNLMLFGHSSHLPIVNNPAYKALNGLENVRLGDDVFIETKTHIFRYRVSSIRLTTADEELVTFRTDRRMITISTCNTFGTKSERFLAEAILVGSESKT